MKQWTSQWTAEKSS